MSKRSLCFRPVWHVVWDYDSDTIICRVYLERLFGSDVSGKVWSSPQSEEPREEGTTPAVTLLRGWS